MEKLLGVLNKHLETNHPALHQSLQKAMLQDEIRALEHRHKVTLPAPLKAMYRWHNGQQADYHESFVNGYCFFPLEEMLLLYTNERTHYGFAEGQFPLLGNPSGRYRSFICYDANGLYHGTKGEIFCLHSSEPFDEDIAENLEQLLQKIITHLASTPLKKMTKDIYLPFYGTKRTR